MDEVLASSRSAATALTAEQSAMINCAVAVVGHNPPGNRSIYADELDTMHIEPLERQQGKANPLIERLKSDPVRKAFAEYCQDDRRADTEQNAYKRQQAWLAWPFAIAIGLSLLIAIIQISTIAEWIVQPWPGAERSKDRLAVAEWETFLRQYVPWGIYLALIATPLMAWRFNPSLHYAKWQSARGTAEAMRREIFYRVTATDRGRAEDLEPWSLLLRLEYFRRWQVEVQQQYFERRQREHKVSVRRWKNTQWMYVAAQVMVGLVLALNLIASLDEEGAPEYTLSMLAPLSAIAMPIEAFGVDYWLFVALLVTLAGACYFYFQQTLGASVRNSARYANVLTNFNELLGEAPNNTGEPSRLTVARLAALDGDAGGVEHYVARVHAIMSLENNDWIRLADLDRGIDKTVYEPAAQSSVTTS